MRHYNDKLPGLIQEAGLDRLPVDQRRFITEQATRFRFTHQELRQLGEIALDLNMWDERPIHEVWPKVDSAGASPKQTRQRLLASIREHWQGLRERPNRYPEGFTQTAYSAQRIKRIAVEQQQLGLGSCPVASPRTRCCNLLTLDAV
ncbi:MAG: DNA photolyase, partial [Pseudomonadota bacterium]